MGASSSSNEAARAQETAELQRQRRTLEEKRRLDEAARAQEAAELEVQRAALEEKRRMDEAARAQKAAELEIQRAALESEKRRLEQIALVQHWTEQRLQEEHRQKEAVDKWRREQQLKADDELRRKLEELKIQQTEQQKNCQQQQPWEASAPPARNASASRRVRETVSVQQRVSPSFAPGKPPLVTAAPPMRSAEPANQRAALNTNNNVITVPEPSVLPKTKQEANKKNSPEANVNRMNNNSSNVKYVEWSIVDYVAEENLLKKHVAASVMELLDDNNTVSFIAKYRRDKTRGMNEDELRNIKKSYERAKQIKHRAVSLIKTLEKLGELTPKLRAFVHESKSLRDLDRVDSIFKPWEATGTKEVGREKIVKPAIVDEKDFACSWRFIDVEIGGPRSLELVKIDIVRNMADTMKKDIRVYEIIKMLRSKYEIDVETNFAVADEPITLERELNRQKYLSYDNFKTNDKLIGYTDVSNIIRGEAEKVLTVKIIVPPQFSRAFKERCSQLHIEVSKSSPMHKELIIAAIDCMYDTWARPSIEKWTREEIDEIAEIATMQIIASHVKRLLHAPALSPWCGKVVIGVFSLDRKVCKLAAVSERGDYLESEKMYLHSINNPVGAKYNAERTLVRMVNKYNCTTLAVGNGAMSNENQKFISELIKKNSFLPLEVSFRVVDEAGLLEQFHSCSNADTSEFLTDAAVSIARRLQDPVTEFVKIEPKHLVEEDLRRDVPEKLLAATLNDVIVEAVSSVGVDLNTAPVALLRRVAGLNEAKAKSIVQRRDSSGPFTKRADLIRVKGIGAKTFEQCAGFVRIIPETAVDKDGERRSRDLFNCLDQTSIHPNSYDVAEALLKAAGCNIDQFGTSSFIFALRIFAGQGSTILAKKFGTSKNVIEQIVTALTMERALNVTARLNLNEDVNTESSWAGKLNSNLNFDNLTIGTILTGEVCSVKSFGAFVDAGLEKQGLIHETKMNGISLSVGQQVETVVHYINRERRTISLRLLRCI